MVEDKGTILFENHPAIPLKLGAIRSRRLTQSCVTRAARARNGGGEYVLALFPLNVPQRSRRQGAPLLTRCARSSTRLKWLRQP
jgi:hypothetical protein